MNPFKGRMASGVWAIVASLLVVTPAAAAGGHDSAAPPRAPTLTKLSAATLETLQPTISNATRYVPVQSTDSDSSPSFFKTKKGAVVIGLIAAGFGYTLYSKSHDRVKSPVR